MKKEKQTKNLLSSANHLSARSIDHCASLCRRQTSCHSFRCLKKIRKMMKIFRHTISSVSTLPNDRVDVVFPLWGLQSWDPGTLSKTLNGTSIGPSSGFLVPKNDINNIYRPFLRSSCISGGDGPYYPSGPSTPPYPTRPSTPYDCFRYNNKTMTITITITITITMTIANHPWWDFVMVG